MWANVDPAAVRDWNERLLASPRASVFHTTNWLRVLQDTYGYRPHYFTRWRGGELAALLPCMEVRSWLTGVRGVSLPFSDYCDPIVESPEQYREGLEAALHTARQRRWKFLELRGGEGFLHGMPVYTTFLRHHLDLQQNEASLLAGLRCNYRSKIRKASRNDLTVHILRAPEAMTEYYRLHCLTRKRHGFPPQPVSFFTYLHSHIMAHKLGFVALLRHRGRYIAGAVFLTFGHRAMYKFGASDMTSQYLYANYALFWHTIQWLRRHDYEELCFGRSAPGNAGLIQFKSGWGASVHPVYYYRYELKTATFVQHTGKTGSLMPRLYRTMPVRLLRLTGSVLYPHLG